MIKTFCKTLLQILCLGICIELPVFGTPWSTFNKAPDFSIPDLTGREVHLSEFSGKVVLLDFWATWCTPCRRELPVLEALYRNYDRTTFAVVGISMDEDGAEQAVKAFVHKEKVVYPILISNARPIKGFPAHDLPRLYLIDQQSRIVREYLGYQSFQKLRADIDRLLNQKTPS